MRKLHMSISNENQDTTRSDVVGLIHDRLEALCTQGSLDPLKKMFWTDLGYKRVNQPLPYHNWRDSSTVEHYLCPDDPLLLFATNEQGNYDIIYIHLSSQDLPLTHERPIIHN